MVQNPDDTGIPSEKWLNRIRYFTGSPAQVTEFGPEFSLPFPDRYRVTDLIKTEQESAALTEIVVALNDFRRSVCGLPPLALAPTRVHVISAAEFQAKIAPPGRSQIRGKSDLGHVYLRREPSFPDFMAVLAHEAVHAASYLWLDVWDRRAVSSDGLKWPLLTTRRSGLVLVDPSFGTWLPHFHGLNEMATEMAAMAIRRLVASQTALLDDAGRESLRQFTCSPPLMLLADRLVLKAVPAAGGMIEAMQLLFGDYFGGTDRFLAALEAGLPGATAILRRTGARPEELLVAARDLGFDREAAVIQLFCETT